MAPFLALKYAPPAMAKLASRGGYPNAAPKDRPYGSVVVVSSVASTYGGVFCLSLFLFFPVVEACVEEGWGSLVLTCSGRKVVGDRATR